MPLTKRKETTGHEFKYIGQKIAKLFLREFDFRRNT